MDRREVAEVTCTFCRSRSCSVMCRFYRLTGIIPACKKGCCDCVDMIERRVVEPGG